MTVSVERISSAIQSEFRRAYEGGSGSERYMHEAVETIGQDLGRMLEALAGLVFVSLLVPLVWGEYWAMPALIVSGLIPFSTGYLLTSRFHETTNPGKLHGMIIAAMG